MSDEPLQPSQEAREAAAELCERGMATKIRNGNNDDHMAAQAFARFEALIRADQRERDAKVAEGRQQIAQDGTDLTGFYYVNAERRHVAAAIRKEPPHAN